MADAEKKLIVFWKLLSMSKDVAKKAECQGGKTYKVEPKKSEFPADKDPDQAIEEIYREFGRREDFWNGPMKSVMVAHSFAEIVGHKIT